MGELTLKTSRCKRIQLYRTDLQDLSEPIRIKVKKLLSGQIVIFRSNFFRPPSKMPSRTPMVFHMFDFCFMSTE